MKIIQEKLKHQPFLIAVHRGSSMGNIVENTIPAFHAAIQSHADILEIDVIRSTDGTFYIFHDGNEKRLLGKDQNIKTMNSSEIESLQYRNPTGTFVSFKVEKLEDVLHTFKGDILINIDRSWDYWDTLLPFLDQFEMEEQIILKSPVKKEYLELLNAHPVNYMYMPIIKEEWEMSYVEEFQNIHLMGMEIIAESEESPFFQDETIQKMKEKELFVWVNAIKLDDDHILYGEYDDDASIMKGPEYGWAKIVEKGADMIQTDWPHLLSIYRETLKRD